MPWHTVSLDELRATEQKYQELKLEPAQQAVMLLDYVLEQLVGSLGVDVSAPDTIPQQQDELGIQILELTPEEMPLILSYLEQRDWKHTASGKALGIYIIQHFVPKFFIPDPHVTADGRVVVEFYNFDKDVVVTTGNIKIPIG